MNLRGGDAPRDLAWLSPVHAPAARERVPLQRGAPASNEAVERLELAGLERVRARTGGVQQDDELVGLAQDVGEPVGAACELGRGRTQQLRGAP